MNERGVKVMNQSIPPKFAIKGYEVVTQSGIVLETIAPAPKPEEIEAARQRQFLKEKYLGLRKRYSSVNSIKSARTRKFDQIDANITIQKGNLTNIQSQIDKLNKSAANSERSGRKVPQKILDNLKQLKQQFRSVSEQIDKRKEERELVNTQFERDMLLFSKGRSLLDASKPIEAAILDAGLLEEYTKNKADNGKSE